MTIKEAVEQLSALTGDDPESEHGQAEAILCDFLSDNGFEEVADAFHEAKERVGFWYA